MNKNFLLSLILLVTTQVSADVGTKRIMNNLLDSYMALISYTHANQAIDKKKVAHHIKQLEESFKQSKHNKMLEASNFSPIAHAMREELSEINQYYSSTLDDYAKYRLNRLTSLCMSCHSQLPRENYPKIHNHYKKVIDKHVKDEKDKVRIAYLFRDYKNALKHQKNLLNKEPSRFSLAKVMKTYLVNLNDKASAVKYLNQIKTSKSFSKKLKETASQWSNEIKSTVLLRKVSMNKQEWIRMLISKYLVPREQVLQDRVSVKSTMISYQLQRILYNYLVFHPDTVLSAEILYWLGILENKERNIDLYTLGEMYFEQCMQKHPKSIIARRCYDAYHDAIYEGFTGSSGTHVPKEFKDKLKKYKEMVLSN